MTPRFARRPVNWPHSATCPILAEKSSSIKASCKSLPVAVWASMRGRVTVAAAHDAVLAIRNDVSLVDDIFLNNARGYDDTGGLRVHRRVLRCRK